MEKYWNFDDDEDEENEPNDLVPDDEEYEISSSMHFKTLWAHVETQMSVKHLN